MAIDKSKENSRIQDLLDMSSNQLRIKIGVGINNPSIFKQFTNDGGNIWDYAVAANLLEESDAQWIKEHVNVDGDNDEDEEGEDNPK